MIWLYLALLAYLINALVFITDKHLLAGAIPKYHAYAFWVSILSLSSLLLIPFGVSWLGLNYFLLAVLSGASFFAGLLFLYKSIKESDVSVAGTQVGALGAVFTYLLSVIVLKDTLPLLSLFAFVFLVAGIFTLGKAGRHIFASAVLAGLFFGVYYVLLKSAFINSDFINGLFWTRIGFVGSAFLSLFSSHVRGEVKFSYSNAPDRSKVLFIFNKFMAGIGFLILYFSIQLGNVSLINALLGIQFMFTFLLALILRDKISGIKEDLSKQVLKSKLTGIILILVGLLILFIKQ